MQTNSRYSNLGVKDVLAALSQIGLPLYLAKADIRQRYRRSILGPWWITISTGVMIACIGLIFGALFKSPMHEFLPFLSAGLIIWGYISSAVMDGTSVLISAEAIIKQLPIPVFSHIIRMVGRNLIVFFHNLLIFPIVCLCVQKGINWNILYFIPGIVVLTLNLLWISLLLAIVCTRFRDMSQIVSSLLQIAFYITPIIWMPSLLPARTSVMLLDPNPFYHLLATVREPLLGMAPTFTNWLVSIGLFFTGSLFSILLFNKYRARISYWL
jgi:ABC-type polysaccharide/polyol phosphate export permease